MSGLDELCDALATQHDSVRVTPRVGGYTVEAGSAELGDFTIDAAYVTDRDGNVLATTDTAP